MKMQFSRLRKKCVSQGKCAISCCCRCLKTELILDNMSTTALTAETALLCYLLDSLLEKSGGSKAGLH